MEKQKSITVKTTVNAPVQKVWKCWTLPQHIVNWTHASEDWHAPKAENDLRIGGRFLTRMEAKDGSFGFDFEGTYSNVRENEYIQYSMDDGRKVEIIFTSNGQLTDISETFDIENQNPESMQRDGWQAILDNFKKYTESN